LSSKFLFAFFFAGIVAIVFRERQINSRYFYGVIVVFIFSAITGGLIFQTFGISLLIFIIPFISEKLNLNRFKIFKNDISYGTYIWGYLVGQVLYSFFKFETHSVFLVATVIITTLIAMFSWFAIEKPALNWKKR
jgi:peptidoglycan/LPS O-acetylase OafA/YrhL